jgi:hypothetical protein
MTRKTRKVENEDRKRIALHNPFMHHDIKEQKRFSLAQAAFILLA